MRPRLVLVHGIGPRRNVEQESAVWGAALAAGARAAGHARFAARLSAGTAVDVVFADYSDLFDAHQAQGAALAELTVDEVEIVASLLDELIAGHLDGPVGDLDLRALHRARAQLEAAGEEQGAMNVLRNCLNAATTLLSVGPVRRAGQWVSARLLLGDLAQVGRYLARGERDGAGRPLDERIRARVFEALGPSDGAPVVVSHSLGSVVAFEALHAFDGQVPLLVTIGSPLALRSVVLPRVRPQPPCTPAPVRRWLNFWDRDDLIVARPRLEADIRPHDASGVVAASSRVDSDGLWVHSATKYLADAKVAGPVAEAVARLVDKHV